MEGQTLFLLTFAAFVVALFENQRWFRARQSGMKGESAGLGIVVDGTFFAGSLMSWGMIGCAFLAASWTLGLLTVATSFGAPLVYSFVTAAMKIVDSPTVWIAGTLGVWLLGGSAVYMLLGLQA